MAKRLIGPMQLTLGILVLSVFLRIGSQGMAIASETAHTEEQLAEAMMACEPAMDMEAVEFGPLLASISERQEQLSERESTMAARQLVLDEVEERIGNQMVVLRAAEEKLASTLAIADSAAENDLARLTEVYEKMKPRNAAQLFETMETTFAAGFLSRMRPESAAGILSEMPPELAYSVSVVMAGRNARAPTE